VNRLGEATSPYLLQHKDNPVYWWPWSDDAFAEARRRDVPVLISVGYAACHWCHVMAHESFEDPAVAEVINDTVVSIKVDREERPDVDAVYMTATQAMTGQGGWPMTVFATPDGHPFFCGTYYPKEAFVRLVRAIGQAWRDQREEVLAQGAAVVEAVARAQGMGLATGEVAADAALLDSAAASLHRDYDPTHGGFGGAPKFPAHMALLFLLRHYQRTGDSTSLEIVRHTCEAMARGGMYDQLAGGFARYSVDERWLVPHFEKMLYDNALLLRVYTQLWRLTGDRTALRVATETVRFLGRDLYAGAFVSSLDADTDGVEGATYAWTPAQLVEVLGETDGAWAADLFGVTAAGTFEHGTSVLRLARDVDDADPDVRDRWERVRTTLLAARDRRPQPGRDDKVVTAWAALTVTALAEYASLTRHAAPTDAADADRLARMAGEHLASVHIVDGRVRRVSRDGLVGPPAGVLEDYGTLAEAFGALHQLTSEGRWLDLAAAVLDTALARFGDGEGGFSDTADDAEQLVARPADPTDNATPSGRSSMIAALVTHSALTGQVDYRKAAERALGGVAPLIGGHARFAGYAAAAAEALLAGPSEIAVVAGDAVPIDGQDGDPLVRTARELAPPGAVVVVGRANQPGVPLLADRTAIGGASTAYVCQGFVCQRPTTEVDELVAQLSPAKGHPAGP
jgi:uncharacterized protein YyaL (SSP411 family)